VLLSLQYADFGSILIPLFIYHYLLVLVFKLDLGRSNNLK
jgi:hypothetical protein